MSEFLFNDEERQVLEPVLTRAATDAGYRTRLKNDPHAAIAEETGINPPSGLTMQFAEKPEGVDAFVILPDPIDAAVLSAEELEAVAGGGDVDISGCQFTCAWTGAAP